jgi:hypothetical protein
VSGADALQHAARRRETAGAFLGGFQMANSEGPVGQAPAAWVWSQYRGVVADAHTPVPTAEAPAAAAQATEANVAPIVAEGRNSTLIGVGIAAAILVIAGLTWLFTGQPASSPAPESAAPATESAPVKSEAAPPADVPAPAPAAATTPEPAAPAAQTPPAAAPAAHGHEHAKKKKQH